MPTRLRNTWPWLWGLVAVRPFGINTYLPPRAKTYHARNMAAGDGQQAGNFDCMGEFFQMRGMSAKALKLAPSGNALPASLANALEIRTRLLKVLRDVYGDTANKYFASGNKWTFVPTEPNGMCGLQARGIIHGADNPRDEVELADVFSPLMKTALHKYANTLEMVDVMELLQDVIQQDIRFTWRAVWVRAIATMNADTEKCCFSLRAMVFRWDNDLGALVPDAAGAWPLAATPTEPPQPCHGSRAINSVAPCCSQTTPPPLSSISSRPTTARTSSTRPRSSAAPLSSGLGSKGFRVMRATLSSSRTITLTHSLDPLFPRRPRRTDFSFHASVLGHECVRVEGNSSLSCMHIPVASFCTRLMIHTIDAPKAHREEARTRPSAR